MPFINGIGPGELIIILIIALLVVGPGKLPDVGSALGKSIREFRKAAHGRQGGHQPRACARRPGAARARRRRRPPKPRSRLRLPPPSRRSRPPWQPHPSRPPWQPHPSRPPWSSPQRPSRRPHRAVAARAGSGPIDAAPVVAEAAPEAAAEWPAELAPVDEQQPTPSA